MMQTSAHSVPMQALFVGSTLLPIPLVYVSCSFIERRRGHRSPESVTFQQEGFHVAKRYHLKDRPMNRQPEEIVHNKLDLH